MRALTLTFALLMLLPSVTAVTAEAAQPRTRMMRVGGGSYVPFYGGGNAVLVATFRLDEFPVSQAQFAAFLRTHPQWQRGRVSRTFADARYLIDWSTALDPGDHAADEPVVNVSWFAARAYCEAAGARLPTVDEWEYAAAASETARNALGNAAFRARVLELSTRSAARIGGGFRNIYGVADLHGVVREWTRDFNNIMVSDDSRGTDEQGLYCAAGASRARDPGDYAAFLRYALRASVNGRSTVGNLGFRCAGSAS